MEIKRNVHGTLNLSEQDSIISVYSSFKYMGSGIEERDAFFGGQYLAPEDDSFWLKYISSIKTTGK